MKKNTIFYIVLILMAGLFNSCNSAKEENSTQTFKEMAWQESADPIRPDVPGKTPFWNVHSWRFIYAPAFDFDKVANASKYRYEILSLKDSSRYHFESEVPYAPLTPIWKDVPVGHFIIKVIGISAETDSVGLAGSGTYYRASPYAPKDSVYHEPVMPYDSSAMLALDILMHKDYVNYWLENEKPDPDYGYYRYPAKIWSALIVGAVTYARLQQGTEEAKRAEMIGCIIADYLIKVSYPEKSVWSNFPPTYWGPRIADNRPSSHMQLVNNLTIMGADAGNAYLDLYDLTGDKKYLHAAKTIAATYKKTQLDNGSWYLLVNYKTGEPVVPNIAIPTAVINYFHRLSTNYKMEGLDASTEKALSWLMNNPVKTFNWQGQFEDVKPKKPYQNQSREQACDLAVYLFKDKKDIALAENLVRFAEDQFVIWEQPEVRSIKPEKSDPGYLTKNWITPSVQEQYGFWMPVTRSAGIMIDTYWHAYKATGKGIYLAKAKSIANSITIMQKAQNGNYATMFIRTPWNFWLNSVVYPAKVMMTLESNLRKLNEH